MTICLCSVGVFSRRLAFRHNANVSNVPLSPHEPARVRGRALGDRGGPRRTHEADVHRLYEEGGNQSEDARRLVLHAREGQQRPTQQDSRRSQPSLCVT